MSKLTPKQAAPDNVTKQPSPARRMMALFPSTTSGHAYFTPGHETVVTKSDGTKKTKTRAVYPNGEIKDGYCYVKMGMTEKLWQEHLSGGRACVVGFLCDDGTTSVTILDVDDYTVELLDVLGAIDRLKLPLFANASKSGGPHVWVFHEPISVERSQALGRGIAEILGLSPQVADGKVEFFPKPKSSPDKEPFGINVPFLGGETGGYSAIRKKNGGSMTVTEFLRAAEKGKLNPEQIETLIAIKKQAKAARKTAEQDAADLRRGRTLAEEALEKRAGVLEHEPDSGTEGRHKFLRTHAFYLGTLIGAGWIERDVVRDRLVRAVRSWDDQTKTLDTLDSGLAKGAAKPASLHTFNAPLITHVLKTENPERNVWHVTLDGSEKKLEINDPRNLAVYSNFNTQCIDQLNRNFGPMKPSEWSDMITDALANKLEVKQAAEDTTLFGQFRELLDLFLTNRQRATKKEDLLTGRPWEDEDKGRYIFHMGTLILFLEKNGMKGQTPQKVGKWIDEKLAGGEHNTTVKTKRLRLRWIPSAAVQGTPDVDPPAIAQSKI